MEADKLPVAIRRLGARLQRFALFAALLVSAFVSLRAPHVRAEEARLIPAPTAAAVSAPPGTSEPRRARGRLLLGCAGRVPARQGRDPGRVRLRRR